MGMAPGRHIGIVVSALVLYACASIPEENAPCPPLNQVEAKDYLSWLDAGCYSEWESESDVLQATQSDGYAQVFLSPQLLLSLEQGADTHPVGAAAVRVMYLDDRKTVRGYSLSLKTHASNLDHWFWYEHFSNQESPLTARHNAPSCVGCHSHGSDFVQSTLPLR